MRGCRLADVVHLTSCPEDGEPGQAIEGRVHRPDGSARIVEVRQRDLAHDPRVGGVVTTVRDITADRTLQLELACRASRDPLTRLANRDGFDLRLRASLVAGGSPRPLAVLFIDLDDFKATNDTYGHQVGDRVLQVVARRIESCLRPGDLAARLGGDEFAVLLGPVSGEEGARAVAERITQVLAEAAVVDGTTMSCRASVGLAFGPVTSLSQLHQADLALYAAKAAGKGRWSQFPGEQ